MSSFWKVPSGGMTIVVFELSSCIGLNRIILLTSPIDSQVIGRELIIPSTSTNNVRRDLLLILSPLFLSIAKRMLFADRICRFHTPPHVTCRGRITFPTYLLSSPFHKEMIDPFFIHFPKCLLQFNACTNKVGPIVTSNHPNIPSSTDQTSKSLNEAGCYQIACRIDVHRPAGHVNIAPYLF